MGVIELVDDTFWFTLPGLTRAPVHRPSIRARSFSAPGSADDTVRPSSSMPPLPMASDVEWRHLRAQVHHVDERMTNIVDQVVQIS